MAVARRPVARVAPPALAIISASRARVGDRDGERGNFPLILQCRQTPPPFRARAGPSAVSGHHPIATRMSPGGGECRVGRAAAPWDHHRRRGAESSPPPDRHQQTVGCRRSSIATHSAAQAAGAGRAPRRSSRMLVAVHGLAVRSASDAIRAPLTELLKPDGCRAPPRSSRRAAGARHHQRLARASG